MEILHRHHHDWLIYNHAWDPISGSALVDEPTLNPEAWGHCQKAGFAASTACHLKNVSLHWLVSSSTAIWKRSNAVYKQSLSQCVLCPSESWRGRAWLGRLWEKQVDIRGCTTEFLLCSHTLRFNNFFFKYWNLDVILCKQHFGFPTSSRVVMKCIYGD